MDDHADDILNNENYYQRLNLPISATSDDINSAYRKFSLIFHPDKHLDPVRKVWAEHIFNKVKDAYEVLSDPQKRAIYDTLGKSGLEVNGMELISRTRSPNEIREEYERLKKEREERMLQKITNPRGTIVVNVNATELFNSYDDYDFEYDMDDTSSFNLIEISGMSINEAIDVPVSTGHTVNIAGHVATQNGIGTGSVNVTNRMLSSERGWCDVELGIGSGAMIGGKMYRTLSRSIFMSGGTVLQFVDQGITPSMVSTLGMQLDGHSVGYLTYRAGNSQASLATTYSRDSEDMHISVTIQLGAPHSFISFNLMKKMIALEMKARLSLKVGTFGAIAEYGAEKKVTKHTTVSAAVTIGIPMGVHLKLKWTHASQSIVVPIHLAEEFMPAPLVYATLIPIISWLSIKHLILDPMKKSKENRERERNFEANKERMEELKEEAVATIELMKPLYSRIFAEEQRKQGLVILGAIYGRLPPLKKSHEVPSDAVGSTDMPIMWSPGAINVTIPLQCLVKDSRLELSDSNKVDLPGFFEPCNASEEKYLTVKCLYNGVLHQITVKEREVLVLPPEDEPVSPTVV